LRIAIVGSQGKHWTPAQRTKVIEKIKEIFLKHADMEMEKVVPEALKPTTFWNPYAHLSRVILVSGGCGTTDKDSKQKFDGGVDVWAEIVADALGVKKDIKYAETFNWEDEHGETSYEDEDGFRSITIYKKGFKTRNLEIARECDVLYCIDPAWRDWSGGRWTMRESEKLGKEVHLVLIE